MEIHEQAQSNRQTENGYSLKRELHGTYMAMTINDMILNGECVSSPTIARG